MSSFLISCFFPPWAGPTPSHRDECDTIEKEKQLRKQRGGVRLIFRKVTWRGRGDGMNVSGGTDRLVLSGCDPLWPTVGNRAALDQLER